MSRKNCPSTYKIRKTIQSLVAAAIAAGTFSTDAHASSSALPSPALTSSSRSGQAIDIEHTDGQGTVFRKPVDNIGHKSIEAYNSYAASHIAQIRLPGSELAGRVFVGQRKDPFVVNLGETFDLVNLNPLGASDGARDSLADKNVTSLILEVPIALLKNGNNPVIGCWSTASRIAQGTPVQQSRLGMALVNKLVIGLKDKDAFNASEPKDDAQFLDYVTHPTLPALLEILFGVKAPTAIPRSDLVAGFLTGVEGLNKNTAVGEMVRLNMDIAPKPPSEQHPLGVLGGSARSGLPRRLSRPRSLRSFSQG
ncbi:MAG: DUF4331 domain-containing protein [Verrucomicrobiales bacterium]